MARQNHVWRTGTWEAIQRADHGGKIYFDGKVSRRDETREEALKALREAVELYFEDTPPEDFSLIQEAEVEQELIHAQTTRVGGDYPRPRG